MAISKRTVGWCKVYLFFPLSPVLIETVLRFLFRGEETSLVAIPAYSSALVSIMAISIFLHDELNRYRLPDPDEDLTAELVGNRYTMIFYFLFACTLFCGVVLVSLLNDERHVADLVWPLNVLRALTILIILSFVRRAVALQVHYKLSVML
jgi:hypothetical protein